MAISSRIPWIGLAASLLLALSVTATAQVSVLTQHYDNDRTGANPQETQLTPVNVKSPQFHKLFTLDVDEKVEAWPLYVPNLTMPDGQPHNVVYVCTMNSSVYAFDADTGGKIWQTDTLSQALVNTNGDLDVHNINKKWGILSTPVTDPDSRTMYLVTVGTEGTSRVYRLHALDIVTKAEKRPPIELRPSLKSPTPADPNRTISFDPQHQKQRAALVLARGPAGRKTLFIPFGMLGEGSRQRHGWVVAFDVNQLDDLSSSPTFAAFCTTAQPAPQDKNNPQPGEGYNGGIWHAGGGPAADENGDLYFLTGNGSFNGTTDFAESFVRLRYTPASGTAPASLAVVDSFTPFLDMPPNNDNDLGSGGPVLLPGTKLVTGMGKDGILYVVNRDQMGGRDLDKLAQPPFFATFDAPPGDPNFDPRVGGANGGKSEVGPDGKTHHQHGTPVFYNSPNLGPLFFVWGENERLRAFQFANGKFQTTPIAKGLEVSSLGVGHEGGMPGGMLCLSADGTKPNTAILWASFPPNGNANTSIVPGTLAAYDATNFVTKPDGSMVIQQIWNSDTNPGDQLDKYAKFNPPMVANGRVYLSSYSAQDGKGSVIVYGLK